MAVMTNPGGRSLVRVKRYAPGRGPERLCPGCGEYLAANQFGHGDTVNCLVCIGRVREARPWTDEQTARLYAAARGALELWPRYADRWHEEDLILWRELLLSCERLREQP